MLLAKEATGHNNGCPPAGKRGGLSSQYSKGVTKVALNNDVTCVTPFDYYYDCIIIIVMKGHNLGSLDHASSFPFASI